MQDNSFLPHHNDDDVCNSKIAMFKVGKLREALKEAFKNQLQTALKKESGVVTSVVRINQYRIQISTD